MFATTTTSAMMLSSRVRVMPDDRKARAPAATVRARRCAAPGIARASSGSDDVVPLMVRAARKEKVERAPAWMMRQAGRYMKEYRDLAVKHPSFRERSETTDLIVDITLQPFRAFKPDGVILFSDILTPFPAFGIDFEIDDYKGPMLEKTIRSKEDLKMLHDVDLSKVEFVAESLKILRQEVGNDAAVLGFVGAPWTLCTYIVEGQSTSTYKTIKSMCFNNPEVLHSLLSSVADALAVYVGFQIDAGAQVIQVFDSWGGQLPPHMWEEWSKPYIDRVVRKVQQTHPGTPITLYANGSGGLLERMSTLTVDTIGLDWTIDMEDGRRRVGDKAVQGNVDPVVLFAGEDAIEKAVKDVCRKAGPTGHVLNLGHGVLVGTPEESVKHFFDVSKTITY